MPTITSKPTQTQNGARPRRFSKLAVVTRHPSGFWCLSMRVANLRKHQILQPSIRMVHTVMCMCVCVCLSMRVANLRKH